MKTSNCETCKKTFSYEPLIGPNGREWYLPKICDECKVIREAGLVADREAESKAKRQKEWELICPPLYRYTDASRLSPEFQTLIKSWEFGPKGIGLVGSAGLCKTRTAFEILKAHHFSSVRVIAASNRSLRDTFQNQFSDDPRAKSEARLNIEKFHDAQILMLDDIGKSKMTPRVEEGIYDLLEDRSSNMLPTIWTANASADELSAMMSPDRADPIIRRLVEFSEVYPKQK